jgi:uncharacterized protein YndB with AHSA1/START domain
MTRPTPDTELVLTRIFDAPRELVYQAFIDPEQLSQWFGPVGYSVPVDTIEVEPRVGGKYHLTMVSEDGTDRSPITSVFTEVVENELLVGSQEWEGAGLQAPGRMQMRIEFHDESDNRTRLVIRQGPFTEETRDMTEEGWLSSFTKLDTVLKV